MSKRTDGIYDGDIRRWCRDMIREISDDTSAVINSCTVLVTSDGRKSFSPAFRSAGHHTAPAQTIDSVMVSFDNLRENCGEIRDTIRKIKVSRETDIREEHMTGFGYIKKFLDNAEKCNSDMSVLDWFARFVDNYGRTVTSCSRYLGTDIPDDPFGRFVSSAPEMRSRDDYSR